jgi:hypothetical protein
MTNKVQRRCSLLRAGIMQLALLAPYNNLASSVAAALVPTLLTPKIRITDENDRTFSYGSDSNNQSTDTNQHQINVEHGKASLNFIFCHYKHNPGTSWHLMGITDNIYAFSLP